MIGTTSDWTAVVSIDGSRLARPTGPKKKAPSIEQEFYSFKQAGERIGKSAEAVRKYVDRGLLVARKQGKLRFISRAELDRFAGGLAPVQLKRRA
jgi:hypothetical protein